MRLPSVLVAALVTAAPVAAEPPLTVRALFSRPLIEGNRPDEAMPSPDGRWVAFAWNDAGERSPVDLWLVPSDGSDVARNLTHFRDPTPVEPGSARPLRLSKGAPPPRLAIESFDWSPDATFLVAAAGGDLYRIDLAGRVLRLTDTALREESPRVAPDGRRVAFIAGGNLFSFSLGADMPALVQLTETGSGRSLESPIWSPDGTRIAAVQLDESERFDLIVPDYRGDRATGAGARGGWRGETPVVIAVGGGEPYVPAFVDPIPVSVSCLRFSPSGRQLVVDGTTRDMRTRTLHVIDLDEEPAPSIRLLDQETDPAWAFSGDPHFTSEASTRVSPDGTWLLFLSERSGFAQPWIVSLAGGKPKAVAAGSFEVTWADWADEKTVLLLDNRVATFERRLHLVSVATGATRPFGDIQGLSRLPALSANRTTLVVQHSRFEQPAELLALRVPDGLGRQLTDSVPKAFSGRTWIRPRVLQLTADDDTPVTAMVYEPSREAPPSGWPAVVFVHGAGYLQNVVDGWTWYAPNFKFHSLLVARGFVVLEVDYRGSAGYGRAFRVGVHGYLGGKDLDDVVTGAKWLRARGDIGRIGIYGGSYGGFLTLMALFRAPEHFDAGAALRFVADWENYHRSNPRYCVERLGTPEDEPEAYRKSSPIHFVAGLEDPLLLLHGVVDNNVHFQDCAQLTARLIELGKDFELMMYPAEGHGFVAEESWIDEYQRILGFFERTLRDPPIASPPTH